MAEQDYNKDLFLVIAGHGVSSLDNIQDNLEDFIFGPMDNREVTLLIPYTQGMSRTMTTLLNDWAVGKSPANPNYPIVAYVEPEAGHRSISSAKTSIQIVEEHGTVADSMAFEIAMSRLVDEQINGNEVACVILYDENSEQDKRLVGDAKNFQSIPTYNLCEGMVDSFPGFLTTDEQIRQDREREEFETKEAIRIAAEKEEEKLAREADRTTPTKKAAAPRKRAAKKVASPPVVVPEETPKTVEELLKDHPGGIEEFAPKVGDKITVGGIEFTKKAESPWEAPDTLSIKRENMVALGEGIKEMADAFSKTINALTAMIGEK